MRSPSTTAQSSRSLEGLNQAQKEAVTHTGSNLLVVAGAGTGKTRVIVHRMAYLIESGRVRPRNLLAVTFTNRAAQELRRRVQDLIGPEGNQVSVGTFHWLGYRILRQHGSHVEVGPRFTLASPRDSLAVIRRVQQCSSELATIPTTTLRDAIAASRNGKTVGSLNAKLVATATQMYVSELRRTCALDLDDLILESVQLLRGSSSVRHRIQGRIAHTLVDEYQDTNRPQVELLGLISRNESGITAVGDDDQAVYGWRYASAANMLAFESTFAPARVVRLEENYRSTRRILNMANASVATNQDRLGKTLVTSRMAGSKPTVFAAIDEVEEAEYVARSIHDRSRQGATLDEIAVLFRVNSQSRSIEDALVRHELPYEFPGGRKFYDRPEVARIIDGLRFVADPSKTIAVESLLQQLSGVGPARSRRLAVELAAESDYARVARSTSHATADRARDLLSALAKARELKDLVARVTCVIDTLNQSTGLPGNSTHERETAEANVAEFLSLARAFETESVRSEVTEAFLDRLSLVRDRSVSRVRGIQLMTVHGAKGLEFDTVFLVGVEDGLLPHRNAVSTVDIEEERRLFHVAITRARNELHLSYARNRSTSPSASGASSFIDEIPRHLISLTRPRYLRPINRLASVKEGERVDHPRWGIGVVMRVSGSGPSTMVAINFQREGMQTIQLKHAPLKRLS